MDENGPQRGKCVECGRDESREVLEMNDNRCWICDDKFISTL